MAAGTSVCADRACDRIAADAGEEIDAEDVRGEEVLREAAAGEARGG
jgi:hypothetical protein